VEQPLDTDARAASSSALCNTTKPTCSARTSSWWREPNQHQAPASRARSALQYIYNLQRGSPQRHPLLGNRHGSSTRLVLAHKGLAWGVFDAGFAVTGRLSISSPTGGAHIHQRLVALLTRLHAPSITPRSGLIAGPCGAKVQQTSGSVTCGTGKRPPEPAPAEQVLVVLSAHLDVLVRL
jgi:hypothetical protein